MDSPEAQRPATRLHTFAGFTSRGSEMLSSGCLAAMDDPDCLDTLMDCNELHYRDLAEQGDADQSGDADCQQQRTSNNGSARWNATAKMASGCCSHEDNAHPSLYACHVDDDSARSSREVARPAVNHLHIVSDSDTASSGRGGPRVPSSMRLDTNRAHPFSLDDASKQQLIVRIQHSRQTMDFVNWQLDKFSRLAITRMSVWEALDLLPAVEGVAGHAQEHAMRTAERCRLAFPDLEWAPLVGLIHGLGNLLGTPLFGSEPEWAVQGDSYPLGCRFSEAIAGHQFFSVCPDRRRRIYNTPLGIYSPGCGLENVYFTWSSAEYMFTMLLLNDSSLPPEALFLIRYQRFSSLLLNAYDHLMSDKDKELVPMLRRFMGIVTMHPSDSSGLDGAVLGKEEFKSHYDSLIKKFLGSSKLAW